MNEVEHADSMAEDVELHNVAIEQLGDIRMSFTAHERRRLGAERDHEPRAGPSEVALKAGDVPRHRARHLDEPVAFGTTLNPRRLAAVLFLEADVVRHAPATRARRRVREEVGTMSVMSTSPRASPNARKYSESSAAPDAEAGSNDVASTCVGSIKRAEPTTDGLTDVAAG